MCGIFGFNGFQDFPLLKRMGTLLQHRGPDSDGFFTDGNYSMGMVRLSIIDLAGGDQPIYNENKTIAVCYNGEIYNYVELKQQLEKLGHTFTTHTDTEVIVHAYEQWDVNCVDYFNGMFAFALYDKNKKQIFAARDRCGQKPFYYYFQDGKFVFASEIKAILAADFIPRETNVAAIDAYLTLRYVPEPRTMFRNIFTLPSAHYLILDANNNLTISRYWDINLTTNYLAADDAYSALDAQLRQSVNLAMRSDVPVGAYLSSGIDSSLLVALMCEEHNNVNTYSIGFNSKIDETAKARETARLLGTNHHEIHCGPKDFTLLPKIIYHMDRPVGDALIIAFYKLAEAASKDVKVVIGGEGADEIFAGYQFHKTMQLLNTYFRIMPDLMHNKMLLPLLKATPNWFLNKFFAFPAALGKEGKQHLIASLEKYPHNSLFENYIALKTLWRQNNREQLYTDTFKQDVNHSWIPEVRDNGGNFLDRLLKLQWDEWLPDWSLIRQDKNTMAHSLEMRLPFLDHNLIELGFRIPPKLKANWFKDKIIERKLAKQLLPKEITNRPKIPFYFPMNHFFEHPEFKELIKLTLNKNQILKRGYFNPDYIAQLLKNMESREFIFLKQVVSLVVLELWHMIHIDKQLP